MLSIVRGDNKSFVFTLYDEDGVVINLSSCTLFATVKQNTTDADSAAKISSTLTLADDPTTGVATWALVPADTQYLSGPYFMDIQLKSSAGLIDTILRDTFVVYEDVTIRTT